jgi:hypothetical protein
MPISSVVAVRFASVAAVDITTATPQPIDGTALPSNIDYFLLKNQADPSKNGIYSGNWPPTKVTGYTAFASYPGMVVTVQEGDWNAGTVWSCIASSNDPVLSRIHFEKTSFSVQKPPRSGAPATNLLQNYLDSLINYDTAYDYAITINVSSLTLQNSHFRTLIRCSFSGGNTIITIPTGLRAGFSCILAVTSKNEITRNKDPGVTWGTIDPDAIVKRRFQAIQIVKQPPPSIETYNVIRINVAGGGEAVLGPGTFLIDGDGLKIHPAVSISGQGLASSILSAAQTLTGIPDSNDYTDTGAIGIQSDPALLTICARSYSATDPGDSRRSWQPEIRRLQFDGSALTSGSVSGCILELGYNDPDFDFSTSADYKGGSANFIDCGVYKFRKVGIWCKGNRQRFFAQYLRCLGNGDDGLRINGNDPVVGQRCGFGSNGGHQVVFSACSGVVMSGVNAFTGSSRSTSCLACKLTNVNGAAISNCVFNDTIVIDTGALGNFASKGVSVTGCDFRPNGDVFDSSGVPVGTTTDEDYDSFVYVVGRRNVTLSGNTYCLNANGVVFKYILSASGGARVDLSATLTTESTDKNYEGGIPIRCDSTSRVTYDIRDIYLGSASRGTLGLAAIYPDMRGVLLPASVAAPSGYRVLSGGPALASERGDLTDEGFQYSTVANNGNVSITRSARYCYVVVSGTAGSTTISGAAITLPSTSSSEFSKDLTIIIIGSIGTLNWSFTGTTVAELALPSKIIRRATVSLGRRRDVGSGAVWYRVQAEESHILVAVRDEATSVQTTTGFDYRFRLPFALVPSDIRGMVSTSVAGAPFSFDITTGGGTSLFSATPVIAVGNKSTAQVAATAGTPTYTPLADDQELRIVVPANSTTGVSGGQGFKVWLTGFKN